jgi:hypothetical protein
MAPRKTKPIPVQVIGPFRPSNARFQARLIDFDTDSAVLEEQHMTFLSNSMSAAKQNSAFHVRLFGFASRVGSTAHNEALARNRMNAVLNFIQKIDQRALASVEEFQNFGESKSGRVEADNSAEFRAVEVHIFIGEIPTPPPPDVKPIPRPRPPVPLPGGPRFKEWEIAAPGGVAVAEGIGGGFNIFLIRNVKQQELRGYIQPAAGIGASISLSGLKKAAQIIQQIITGAQGGPPDFIDVTASFPVTFTEVEECLVRVASAGAGLLKGASFAVITFSGTVSHHGPSGQPIRTAEDIFKFISAGEGFQLGAGATDLVGPLIRIPG